jgi:hypothetical protein
MKFALPAGMFDAPERSLTPAEAQFAAIGEKKKPKRSFSLAPATIAKAIAEAEEMAKTGDWDAARGVHLVALYAAMHRLVYGVAAEELDGTGRGTQAVKKAQLEWAVASKAAQAFVAEQFAADFGEAVEFVRWAWKREQAREKKRREGGAKDDFRIGWRYQFGARLATDYRLAAARQKSGGGT